MRRFWGRSVSKTASEPGWPCSFTWVRHAIAWSIASAIERVGASGHRNETGRIARRRQTVQGRSEEHTSKLQSLMRNSYAVFCLKKKTTNTNANVSTQYPNVHHEYHINIATKDTD